MPAPTATLVTTAAPNPNGTTLTFTLSAGAVTAGQTMVAFVSTRGSETLAGTGTMETNWTGYGPPGGVSTGSATGDVKTYMFTKIASAGDAAGTTYTVIASANTKWAGSISKLSGDRGDGIPWDTVGTGPATSSGSLVLNTANTGNADTLILHGGGWRNDSTFTISGAGAFPPGPQELADFNGANVISGFLYQETQAVAGTNTARTITAASGSERWGVISAFFPPPASAATDRKDVWGAMPI